MDQFGNNQPTTNPNPQVTSVVSPQYAGATPPSTTSGPSKRNIVKILFIVMGVLIVGELAWAAYTLTRPLPVAQESTTVAKTVASPTPSPTPTASLSFQGPTTATVGATIKVDVILKSSEPTDGADALIKYDPAMLTAQAPTAGTLYQEYPSRTVDAKNGLVVLSGLTSQGSTGFSGTGTLGTLTFKALKAGQTTLSIDYTAGATTESNVIGSGISKDILTGTEPLTITVK